MRTFKQYIGINEWKANSDTVTSIKKFFIYEQDENYKIRIFNNDWPQMNDFINKVYINGENIKIGSTGWTPLAYEPGTYYVEIKGLDQITTCYKMFCNCRCLVSVPLFNTSNVKDMYGMFSNCTNIKDVPLFNTNKVKTMEEMFWGCINLKKVPLFDTQNVTDMSKMFYNCYKLEDVPVFNISSLKSKTFMFYNCNSLNEKTQQKWT